MTGDDGPYGGGFPASTVLSEDAAPSQVVTQSEPSAIDAASQDVAEEGSPVAPVEAGPSLPDGACADPPGPGDLEIDELMIASVAGSGDDGEWFEVASLLDCTVNLRGLHGECPHGGTVSTFDVTRDLWIPPRGTFVVADALDPTIDHALPGPVVAWAGHTGDVLRNQGSTLTLSLSGALVDALTYPELKLFVGVSVEFPSDCDPSQRSDFTRWQSASTSWFPSFYGTPNAPNDDVSCPP